MLIRSDTLQPWRGEPIAGVRHPRNIEQLWTDEELAKVGLYLAVPFGLPEGKRRIGEPSYAIVDGAAIETYAVEDVPPQLPPEKHPIELEIEDLKRRVAALETNIRGQTHEIRAAARAVNMRLAVSAVADDSWISRGQYRTPLNPQERCCGLHDASPSTGAPR